MDNTNLAKKISFERATLEDTILKAKQTIIEAEEKLEWILQFFDEEINRPVKVEKEKSRKSQKPHPIGDTIAAIETVLDDNNNNSMTIKEIKEAITKAELWPSIPSSDKAAELRLRTAIKKTDRIRRSSQDRFVPGNKGKASKTYMIDTTKV